MSSNIEKLAIDTIRTLSIDAVQRANSGHPGTPMAMAPVAYCLWQRFLRFDPADPIWANRDRFVLSVGHASMLLYSLLHLTGVRAVNAQYEALGEPSVTLDDIKKFRQLDSKCPGHPEYRWTSGVETTTGPLGQGVATSVGMASAEKWMATYFNRPGFPLIDHDVYVLAGDGCMMEGVASEAASLAAHLQLDNLCWIYDSNRITIEGSTQLAFSEDVATRFLGYGWHVVHVSDANDLLQLSSALESFRSTKQQPTLIVVNSHIGYGSPNKQDSHSAHGEPLGVEEVKLTKRAYGWPEDAQFLVPEEVPAHFAEGLGARGRQLRDEWMAMFERYRKEHPELADALYRMTHRRLPEDWDAELQEFPADAVGISGRDASAKVLNALAKRVPWLVGGSADSAPSTKTRLTFEGAGDFEAHTPSGRNMHFGVREHAMSAVLNGMSLSKVRPYGSGFLISATMRAPRFRLSALMELPTIHVFTHDSIGVGEDGPTHQPVEQLAALRAVPGMLVLRPADANEVVAAWKLIMSLRHEPAALVLSRQSLPTIDRTKYASAELLARGAYVLADPPSGPPSVILMATGSEVALCLEAHQTLLAEGIASRVVSMPCWELFEKESAEYRSAVLPPAITARVAVERAATFGWDRYTGFLGSIIGMRTFGASAPLKELSKKFGFTAEAVVTTAKQLMR